MTDTPTFVTLKNRGLVKIAGADRHTFLQTLITNNIERLQTEPSFYACLLTPQGKFLNDFIILEHAEELWLDCEGGERATDLAARLTTYKLRANIEITVEPNVEIYAILNSKAQKNTYPDPRHTDLGHRTFTKPSLLEEPYDLWDARRIALTIPDGSRDMTIEKSTMLESGIDHLNGIDFEKGCYIGQELTARMHYRGLAKKHLYTVNGTEIRLLKDKDALEMNAYRFKP